MYNFYPRSPCGERQFLKPCRVFLCLFLSTLSLRRATGSSCLPIELSRISIHALLAESDCVIDIINNVIDNFYPRSPCGERQLYINRTAKTIIFLSTLSLRRATRFLASWSAVLTISIHALLAESDCWNSRQATVHT